MSFILRNFIRNKKEKKNDKLIKEFQTAEQQLENELQFWNNKCVEQKEMIESLQNLISSLSDQLEDAKDALFSEIDYQ
ncbi:unnamed protein product [Wuchereria bancrofti]|uniref:Uncharacterized protein n=1 Tax=Wuchereria bancrofti TaxID=6293 RepID=A0A3P7DUC7_WUCBA|nr:unnamed protein product [Wuchereria bancrofti]